MCSHPPTTESIGIFQTTNKTPAVRRSSRKQVTNEYFNNSVTTQNPNQKIRKRKLLESGDTEDTSVSKTSLLENCSDTTNSITNAISNNCYKFDFYNIPCVNLAKKLLGKILVRHLPDGNVLQGRIVETESYLGGEDKASQSYKGKMTDRNMPMFMKPGTAYVYFTYGMYYCFNISSEGDGAAVLIRAVDPLQGHEIMSTNRSKHRKQTAKNKLQDYKPHELCNGPAKLTMSFGIDKTNSNKLDMSEGGTLYIQPGDDVPEEKIVSTSRIGIDSAGPEWAGKPLRFYELGNPSVSRRDRKAEALMKTS